MAVFFNKDQRHFFRPLTWSSRERMASCLKAIYERLYGPEAAFNRLFDRTALMEEVGRALAACAEQPAEIEPGSEQEEAAIYGNDPAWVVRKLEDYGWLEVYTDSIAIEKAWRLTPTGKRFARALWESDRRGHTTRQRNMRSCANSLKSYLERGDADDLLDAQSYAEQVLDDLTNDTETFRLLIRDAHREALAGKATGVAEFMHFVTERFRKEFGTRLVADSADRLKTTILDELEKLRGIDDAKLAQFDSQLKDRVPAEEGQNAGVLVLRIADRIERLVRGACDTKLPELHKVMANYVNRWMGLIRQSLALQSGEQSDPALQLSAELSRLEPPARDAILADLAERMAPCRVRLFEPKAFRFEVAPAAVEVDATSVDVVADEMSVLEARIRRLQEEHLAISEEDALEYIAQAASQNFGRIRLSQLEPETARQLVLMLAAGAIVSSQEDSGITARVLKSSADTHYFITDDIEFALTGMSP